MSELQRFADLFWLGMPPVQGGSLDQANWFLDYCLFVKQERELLEPRILL